MTGDSVPEPVEQPSFVRPPEGWVLWNDTDPMMLALHRAAGGTLDNPPIVDVMSNLDRYVDEAVAERARTEHLIVKHAAAVFVGWVWWQDGRWHELVQVHRQAVGSYSADTLEELMKTVNDEHGWE